MEKVKAETLCEQKQEEEFVCLNNSLNAIDPFQSYWQWHSLCISSYVTPEERWRMYWL